MKFAVDALVYLGVAIFIIGAYLIHIGLGMMVTGIAFVTLSSYLSDDTDAINELQSRQKEMQHGGL